MMEEQGQVVSVDADHAWVETRRAGACGSCASKPGCGTANLARLFGDRFTRVRVENTTNLRPGDRVVLGVHEHALLRGAAWLYGVPLALFISGAAMGELLASLWSISSDAASALLGGVGFLLGLALVRVWSRRSQPLRQYQPLVLRKINGTEASRVDGLV